MIFEIIHKKPDFLELKQERSPQPDLQSLKTLLVVSFFFLRNFPL